LDAKSQAQPAPAPSPGAPSPPAAGPAPATGTDEAAVEAGRLRKTHGGWRASRVVGATVFSDGNERIGTISDLIVTPEGGISEAVLSVGGFLGIGAKLVRTAPLPTRTPRAAKRAASPPLVPAACSAGAT
jgi:hypothetical protein